MRPILLGLIHQPYGVEHPYQQELYERFPRQPIEDEPVLLGAATWPAESAEQVWVMWFEDGSPLEREVQGEWVKDQAEQSCWKITLPAFRRGQTIHYRIYAADSEQTIHSETFSFTTAGWVPVGEILSYHLLPSRVDLVCNGEEPGFYTDINITVRHGNIVSTRLKARYEGGEQAPAGEQQQVKGYDFEPITLASEDKERLILTTHTLKIIIYRRPYRLEIYTRDGAPVAKEAEPPAWLLGEKVGRLQLRQRFNSPEDEGFFGFGERFNSLNQRGNKLDVSVYDEYENRGLRTYLPIPFFLSSQGYGFHIKTKRRVQFDLSASLPGRWSFEAELGPEYVLEYDVIAGALPRQIIAAYTDLTGKPKLPPSWVFGPWMSSNEWNSQARVMQEVETSLKHGIQVSVVVIEAWSDEISFYIWNDAQYRPERSDDPFRYKDFSFPVEGRWPDPKGMIDELHRLGIRVILWQIPVLKRIEEPHPQQQADEAYMIEQGYCVSESDGSPYRIRPMWFRNSLLLDFTNPKAVAWWMSKREYLLDELGVDGFKTDGGEHIWGRDLLFHNGLRSDELGNQYPNLYVGAYHKFASEKRSDDAVTFSRAGFTGAQAYPCHWAGDEASTWQAYRASLLAGLNLGISGIPFWGWDLAGFSGEIPSAELYLRSAGMATFCPILQYHSEYNHHRLPCRDRTPWNIAERMASPKVIEVYQKFVQLRMKLLPYIEAEARWCVETGEPLMRPLFLDWPEDQQAWQITEQYCFGRSLLVAPVLYPETQERSLYLPAGKWQDFWDGTIHGGGAWITRATPLDIIPVYRRLDLPGPILSTLNG